MAAEEAEAAEAVAAAEPDSIAAAVDAATVDTEAVAVAAVEAATETATAAGVATGPRRRRLQRRGRGDDSYGDRPLVATIVQDVAITAERLPRAFSARSAAEVPPGAAGRSGASSRAVSAHFSCTSTLTTDSFLSFWHRSLAASETSSKSSILLYKFPTFVV